MTKIKLVVGDWSGDGHSQHDSYNFKINLSIEELKKAWTNGLKKINLLEESHFNNYNSYYMPFCSDYEESDVSKEIIKEIIKHNPSFNKYIEDGWLEDNDNDKFNIVEIGFFPILWLEIAKIGNPNLTFKKEKTNHSINIGGYGLYF